MPTYLEQLTARLLIGSAKLHPETIQRHTDFLLAAQNDDGGFAGREGSSDLYYTGFALRTLASLGKLDRVADNTSRFLKNCMSRRESIVDFYSLIIAAQLLDVITGIDVFADAAPSWRDEVADMLSRLRRDDGGFAKAEQGNASSTYHSFLGLLCFELIQREPGSPEALVEFFHSQRMPEGGFREIRVSRRAGTNPTAAAVGGLRILGALTDDVKISTADFLLGMQNDEGGFRANTRIPIADLLSTFTSLLTLGDVGGFEQIDVVAAREFIQSLDSPAGGFLGASWDEQCDVEYTFYGVGSLALLLQRES
jgi:geranylgeranyl transferase type-2 subunit beta